MEAYKLSTEELVEFLNLNLKAFQVCSRVYLSADQWLVLYMKPMVRDFELRLILGDNQPRIEVRGNWDEYLEICDYQAVKPGFKTVWTKDPEPDNWDEKYWMSIYSMQLNRLTPAMKIG
jgi:hypothetical protein